MENYLNKEGLECAAKNYLVGYIDNPNLKEAFKSGASYANEELSSKLIAAKKCLELYKKLKHNSMNYSFIDAEVEKCLRLLNQ